MAKKKKEKQSAEQPAEPEQKRREPPKVPRERNPLLTVLTILLLLLGVSELALWGFFGFSAFRAGRAQRQYEAEREAALEERASRGITAGSAYGPRLKVENGQITWRLEDELPAGGQASSGAQVSQGGGAAGQAGQSQARIYIPKIPYALAEQETDVRPDVQGAQPLTGGTTPA